MLGRVEQLADNNVTVEKRKNAYGVLEYTAKGIFRKPYSMLVPLSAILSEVYKTGEKSKKVKAAYDTLIYTLGSELRILSQITIEEIEKAGGERLAEAIQMAREGKIFVSPGFDGEFGKVRIFPQESDMVTTQNETEQGTLF